MTVVLAVATYTEQSAVIGSFVFNNMAAAQIAWNSIGHNLDLNLTGPGAGSYQPWFFEQSQEAGANDNKAVVLAFILYRSAQGAAMCAAAGGIPFDTVADAKAAWTDQIHPNLAVNGVATLAYWIFDRDTGQPVG